MRQEKGLQNIIIVVLAIAVLVMSVGFATYSETLNINGTATFTAAKWDVRFDKSTQNETSTLKSTTHTVDDRAISYSVTLPKPGSTFTFTVNVKNYGTIDAALKKITMTGLTEAQQAYITHTVNYGGTTYTQTTDNIGTVLAASGNQSVTVTVTVSYNLAAANQLPEEDQEVSLNVSFDYIDANL